MFILKSEILIEDYIFRSVHDIEINKSVSELGDTAIIKMPRKFKVRQNNTEVFTENAIKAGDEVTIKLAYEGKYEGVEFKGYVKKVNTKIPLEIHCEDCIWLLRRKTITHNFGTTTLKKVLEEIVKDTPIRLSDKIPDMRLEKYLIKDRNGAQALQDIRENTGLSAFIDDDNNLYCGLIENTNIGQTAIYDLNYNIISNDLEIIDNSTYKALIRYTYMNLKNEKITVTSGDKDGEIKDYKTSLISDPVMLKKLADEAYKNLKKEGLGGSVTSFLIPFATRGMVAEIRDSEHPHLAGNYFISEVKTTFGMGGARRIVKISNKL